MADNDKSSQKKFHIEMVRQMLTLATAGFGLVAALAWNSLIQEFVNKYVKIWFPNSGLISLLIYAVIITAVAVLVTYQLSRVLQRLEDK
jgi:hypothetical protein